MLAKVKKELKRYGILMLTDPVLPSLTSVVAGAPVKGSWWGHAKGNLMYNLSNTLLDDPKILCVKLINKKNTFLLPEHWPALFAIGRSKVEWQMRGLTIAQKSILKMIEAKGLVRGDSKGFSPGDFGKQLAKLEERLLVFSENVHTDSGKHVRVAISCKQMAKLRRIKHQNLKGRLAPEAAQNHFELLCEDLWREYGAKIRLPWH